MTLGRRFGTLGQRVETHFPMADSPAIIQHLTRAPASQNVLPS